MVISAVGYNILGKRRELRREGLLPSRECPGKIPLRLKATGLKGTAMQISGGWSFQAEGTADAKALGCIPGTARSQSDLRVRDSLEG